MKNLFLFFTIVINSLLSSAQSFEGMVTMIPDFKTNTDPKNRIIIYVKGDKVAMEPNEMTPAKGRIVGNSKTKEYYMLIESGEKKIALNMDSITATLAGRKSVAGQDQNGEQPVNSSFSETGEKRKIDGYNCSMLAGAINGAKAELWIAKDVNLSLGDLLFSPYVGTQFKSYSGPKGMVLEAWQNDSQGNIRSSLKMTPVKQPVEDKLFEIPKGYEKMTMAQLTQASNGNPQMTQLMQEILGGGKSNAAH